MSETNDANQELNNADINMEAETGAETGAEGEKNAETKSFTQEDVDKIISERLRKADARKQAEIKTAVSKAIAEYDRKAKMTEAERAEEASKQREEELSRREQELAIRENRNRAIETLTKQNVPTDLVEYIATADQEETDDNVANFVASWHKALANAIKESARGTAPRDMRADEDRNGAQVSYTGTQVL